MNNYNYKKLTPFKWFILENFPLIDEDFDALTNWQLFCKLGKEINKIINSQNNVGEQMENVTNAFIALQDYVDNYFDNLDVQDEINNKLDDMAESGTLTDIIAAYLNTKALLCFDTVADMKASVNLANGSYARTLGYYSINDGGESIYKIVENSDSNVHQETLTSGLYATLIPTKIVDIRQLGAKQNDNTFDNSTIINEALTKYKYIQINGIYNINNEIEMTQDNLIYSYEYTKILDNSDSSYCFRISNTSTIGTYRTGINKNFFVSYDKFFIQNFNQNIQKIGIYIKSNSSNAYPYIGIIKGITIYHYDIGIKVDLQNFYLDEFNHVHIESCRIAVLLGQENTPSQSVSNSGENIRFEDCIFTKNNLCIYNNLKFPLYFNNCSFDYNGLGFYNDIRTAAICTNCHFETFGRHVNDIISFNNVIGLVNDTYYSTATPNSVYQFNSCELNHYNNASVSYNGYYFHGKGNYILNNCYYQMKKFDFTNLTPLAENKIIKTNNVNYVDELVTRIIDNESLVDRNFVLDDSTLKYYETPLTYSVDDGVLTITINSQVQSETGYSLLSKNKIYNLKDFIIGDLLAKPQLDWGSTNINNFFEISMRFYDSNDNLLGTQWDIASTKWPHTAYNSTFGSDYTGFISCRNPAIKKLTPPPNTCYGRINIRLMVEPTELVAQTIKLKLPTIQFT